MRLLKLIKYKDTVIKIFNNGVKPFPYEYSFQQKGVLVRDRSSSSTIKRCIETAKEDYDMEES